MPRSDSDLLAIIEAIYRDETSDAEWIDGILHAAKPALDMGRGLVAFPFRATHEGFRAGRVTLLDTPKKLGLATVRQALTLVRDDTHVSRAFRAAPGCAAASEAGLLALPVWRELGAVGIVDAIALNGFDTTGCGVSFGPFLPHATKITARFRARFSRVAAHLGIGQRYRRLAKAVKRAPEAVFDGEKLLHAEGEATPRAAREALSRAVVAIDRARGRQRRTDPDGALEAWEGLVTARWSLVDQFESDGRRYVVARENEPFPAPLPILSKRERQVVGYVALGHPNKLIAYELGISISTVGVLLHRAARKLGVKTRGDVAAAFFAASVRSNENG